MTTTERAVSPMHALATYRKAELVDDLVKRGIPLADARELADRLSADPASHRAACERIGEALEFRPA